jgi:Bacterial Ig domain
LRGFGTESIYLLRCLKSIAHTRFVDDKFRVRRIGFDFVTKTRYIDAQVVGVFVVALAPDFTENLAVRENFSSVPDQEPKKTVLGGAEFHFPAIHSDLASCQVHNQISRLKHNGLLLLRRVTQGNAESRQQFAGIERLGHVIVRPLVQRGDFAGGIVLHGKDKDRRASNAPPTVAITSPTNNASFAAPATIVVVARAEDDGTISLVEFFNGGNKLGEATVSPYTFAWTNVPAGNYTLPARATDNLSAATDSISVLISVTSAPPAVVIQDPGTVGGEFHFSFATQAGFTYFVQSTDSFNPIGWKPVTNFTGSGSVVVVTNTVTSAERFYRVEVK